MESPSPGQPTHHIEHMSETIQLVLDVPRKFYRDSVHLINRCTKPDKKEFIKITQAISAGFVIMGFIGYTIKLVHIPINNIIVGGA